MTIPVSRSRTVTARIDTGPAPDTANPIPTPGMSREEHQLHTLYELADDVVVDGVAYSRAEWDRIRDGFQPDTVETPTPATRRTRPTWNGTDAPF
ncbi:hypothetical protein ACIQF5_21740 [Streptomyces goshikiensis]|uniref:hypothetical protein n=1 Tax=Streptomyces goshikiensis TaxID=1942 RepID=UPI0037FD6762